MDELIFLKKFPFYCSYCGGNSRYSSFEDCCKSCERYPDGAKRGNSADIIRPLFYKGSPLVLTPERFQKLEEEQKKIISKMKIEWEKETLDIESCGYILSDIRKLSNENFFFNDNKDSEILQEVWDLFVFPLNNWYFSSVSESVRDNDIWKKYLKAASYVLSQIKFG